MRFLHQGFLVTQMYHYKTLIRSEEKEQSGTFTPCHWLYFPPEGPACWRRAAWRLIAERCLHAWYNTVLYRVPERTDTSLARLSVVERLCGFLPSPERFLQTRPPLFGAVQGSVRRLRLWGGRLIHLTQVTDGFYVCVLLKQWDPCEAEPELATNV